MVEVTAAEDTKVGLGLAVLRLLQVVPPEVNVALHHRAGDPLPIGGRLDGAGDSLLEVVALNGPPSLGDPTAVGSYPGSRNTVPTRRKAWVEKNYISITR